MPIFGLGKKKSTAAPAPATAGAVPSAAAKKTPRLPEPRTLPDDKGDPELGRLLTIAGSRDWNALRGEFAKLDGDDLSSLLTNVCEGTAEIGGWVPDDAGDPLAQAVLGADGIKRGWQVRTGKQAQHVSQDQFGEFHRLLRIAEEHLYASVELDASSVTPWRSLLRSGIGLQVGLEVQERRFEAALERCPGHLGAHRLMLQQLCRKWGGSHERMRAFAAEAMRGPHGDVLGELVPAAYYENWIALPKGSAERDFIRSEESRAEILEAAEHTVFRPGYTSPRSPYLPANMFLWAFARAEMWPQAKWALDATEGVTVAWGPQASDPVGVYTFLRAAVLKKHF